MRLKEIQSTIKDHILSGGEGTADTVIAHIGGGDIAPIQRLQIYRNNYRETLTSALEAYFPAVKAFVGDGFFRTAARFFISQKPPKEAMLSAYGVEFGAFLRSFEHAQSIPYIGDLADLEWMINESQNAAELPRPSEEEAQTAYRANCLALQPYVRLVSSEYPLSNLWMAAKGMIPAQSVHLDQGGQNCLIVRREMAVHIQVISNREADVVKVIAGDQNATLFSTRDELNQLIEIESVDISSLWERGVLAEKSA